MKDKIVTLDAYYDVMEAEIIRARLEANDIPCFIADDNVMNSVPVYNLMMGGVRINVFERDLETCRAILAEEPILAEGDALIACPECNSTNVFYGPGPYKRNWFFALFSALVGGYYPPYIKRNWICKDCGTNFNLLKEEFIEE
jgi:DNA-directed RNA polymerase subunit RPC12/RpoP